MHSRPAQANVKLAITLLLGLPRPAAHQSDNGHQKDMPGKKDEDTWDNASE